MLKNVIMSLYQKIRKPLALVFLAAIFLNHSLARANEPVVVAVIDAPIDYENTEILAALDKELLEKLTFVDEKGVEKNWYQLNNEIHAELQKRLNEGRYQEQVDFLNGINALISGKLNGHKEEKQILKSILKGLFKFITSKKFRIEINLVEKYLHGTHVAGLVIKSLTNIRLISFPLVRNPKRLTASQIWKFNAEKERSELRNYFKQISEAFQKNNVRVVNLSIATSDDIALKSLKQNTSLLTRLLTIGKKQTISHEKVKIFKEELELFFKENPRTVFVLAAGNEKTDLDLYEAKQKIHTAMIKAPNLIKVGSINAKGRLSKFSNYSENYVDIVANGEGVLSAKVGGGEIHLSGTSMATPIVANRVAEIIAASPSASAEEVIESLFLDQSIKDTFLTTLIAGNRVLGGTKAEKTLSLEDLSFDAIKTLIETEIIKFKPSNLRTLRIHITKKDGSKMTLDLNRNDNGKVSTQLFDQELGPVNACSKLLETRT